MPHRLTNLRSRTNAGADHSKMREVNRSLVLDLIKQQSPVSRAAIAKATALAKPTVSAIVDDLIRDGVIREVGTGQASKEGGRPPIMIEFDARSHYVIGVHLGVRQTTLVVADARGEEIDRVQSATAVEDPTSAIPRLASMVDKAFSSTGRAKHRLAAVGVCVPGLVELASGNVMLAPNLGWTGVPLREALGKALKVPVFIHNTAQASAVAESIEGAGNGAQNLIFLYVGTGVGAGVLTDGHIYHGGSGIAGEIGHCRVPGIDRQCNCGLIGCLETVASGPAIARAASSWLKPNGAGEITAADVAAAAESGDSRAVQIFKDAGEALGTATSWLINLFNPEVVVVGGGVVGAGRFLLDPLRQTALDMSVPQASNRVAIKASALGQEAEVRGAVLVALQYSETYYRLIFQT
jgi:N-acetylglucosamine repressor